ncbi:MAG: hypothetical protein JO057_02585 [Chloroflexi bacterium]|nr:hypothetical protein [Chloroflexota bacterium]
MLRSSRPRVRGAVVFALLAALATLSAPLASVAAAQSQPAPRLDNLHISPESGPAGTSVTIAGAAQPNTSVDLQWLTLDGSYQTETTPETVAYKQRTFSEKRVPISSVATDDQGQFTTQFTIPEDYGELHDIRAVVDGQDIARGGFEIRLAATATPSSGPIGTPIHLRVTGLNPNLFSGSTLAVRYDNAYTGLLTAATTGGTADATIRASGTLGDHAIFIGAGTVPAYLNIHQSPYDFLYSDLPDGEGFKFTFTTTADNGAPPDTLEWPAADAVRSLGPDEPRTTFQPLTSAVGSASLEPASGPIETSTHLTATGLQPDADVALVWMTARGNRVSDSGWDVVSGSIGTGHTDAQGSLATDVNVPDDLGGWHELQLVQNRAVMNQTPFFVERSLVSVEPAQPRAGDTVTIHAKGLGWTELDNGFAVTYDNAFVGYACGFNSNGDVAMPLVATGGPGTHLIDLYPMVYNGQDRKAWYWAPVLTFAHDFPGLGLGYRLPAYRLAITIPS